MELAMFARPGSTESTEALEDLAGSPVDGWWFGAVGDPFYGFFLKRVHRFTSYFIKISFDIDMMGYGGFLKWGYPQIIHLNRIFPSKPSILDHFRLPPFMEPPIFLENHLQTKVTRTGDC